MHERAKWCTLGKYVDRGCLRYAFNVKECPNIWVNQRDYCIAWYPGHANSPSSLVGAILLLNSFVSHVAWLITSLLQVLCNKLSDLLSAGSDATTFLPKTTFIDVGGQLWGR